MSLIKNINLKLNNFCLSLEEVEVPDQGMTVVMGKSGSGKSTLLKVLMGWFNPKGWSWLFKEQDLSLLPVEKRKLGVLFQENDIFHHLTVRDNLLFSGRVKKETDLSKRLIQKLDLNGIFDKKGIELSGGERQRVALANAIMTAPNILLLDEPFNSLDRELKSQAVALTLNIIDEFKIPAIMVTHDEADKSIAKKLLKIYNGKVTEAVDLV